VVQPASQVKGELARLPRAQCASTVLMIRPAAFGSNPETAASNAFQSAAAGTARDVEFAMAESDAVAEALVRAGVEVIVVDDTPEPAKPDAAFPNNWLSLHHDGTAVLYPMLSPLRRRERRRDVIATLESSGFAVSRILDLTGWESSDVFLEGTGSMVLDHRERVAWACESPRTNARPLEQFATELGYEARTFRASGPAGEPVYHTNVMMCIGERFALACLQALPDATQQRLLREGLEVGERELIEIDRAQMGSFAGNALALRATDGTPLVAMSAAAWGSLSAAQHRALERHGRPVTPAIPTVERLGGGSVRCMLAEVFLPRTTTAGESR